MSDLFNALNEIKSEMGINPDYMREKISKAIFAVCKNTYGIEPIIEFDSGSGELIVEVSKIVSEKVEDEMIQISLEDALKISSDAKLGDSIVAPVDTKQFGRIAAQTVRNVVRQGLRDGERELITKKLMCYEKEVVSAQIVRIDRSNGLVRLKIGESETSLPKHDVEYVGIGNREEGDFIKVYVVRIETYGSMPVPIVSRSCPELVSKLFESEIPEINQGIVSIKSIAREAGMRTKIAVHSNNPDVDPVGACIGDKGNRINSIVDELDGEKIDIIRYSDIAEDYISEAISPAKVLDIQVDKESSNMQNECSVTVPDNQLSLAIGIKGQNVRLASRLTGWKINLRPESGYYGE